MPDSTPPSRPSGSPLLTQAALEHATDHLRAGFKERMQREADDLLRVSSSYTDRLLAEAYVAGVRDGFVQGAEAQARIQEAESASA